VNTELISRTTICEIVAYRNAALAKMDQAIQTIQDGHSLAEEALELAEVAHKKTPFYLNDRTRQDSYQRIFKRFDADASRAVYRQQLDAQIWMYLISATGLTNLMDKTAKEELYADLCGEVVEVTEDNAYALFESLKADANLIFQRGLARAFGELDRRFKSHDSFKLGSRIILTHVFDSWGMWNFNSRMWETLIDIERVFAVLDNQTPRPELREAITKSREGGFSPRQSYTETEYFRVRTYKNGNAHLWFTRDDLVDKANHVLADYYGVVLPDGVPKEDPDLETTEGALSKELQFYPTPAAVAEGITKDLYWLDSSHRVLEPSAGDGRIVEALLKHTEAQIDAVEVHPGRCQAIPQDRRVHVTEANFFHMFPVEKYDFVVMNPPFYGTHWMEHVIHAFKFLKPGGTLKAILPVTAELGESRKHKAFRKWAAQHTRYGNREIRDLPAESFAASGTRINTVVLTLYKK